MHLDASAIIRKLSTLAKTRCTQLLSSKIKALVYEGHYEKALQSYSIKPLNATKFVFPSILKACASIPNLNYGKTIHATTVTMGLQFDPYITASLINMYVTCGSINNAAQVFGNVSERDILVQDVTIWNSMIDGYFRNGLINEGVFEFHRMQDFGVKPDGYSLSILLGEFDDVCWYSRGKEIHGYVVRNSFDDDPFVVTALLEMYGNCFRPEMGWYIFQRITDKSSIVTWNAMMKGFLENGMWMKSLELYSLVKYCKDCQLSSVTLCCVLTSCSQGEDIDFGRQVHCDVIKLGFQVDPYVRTSLLTVYAKCGLIEQAKEVFLSVLDKEAEIWNAMISGYSGCGYVYEALNVYCQMHVQGVRPDSSTISNVLVSCSMVCLYDFGRALHGELVKRPIQNNVTVQSALLTMYSKSGILECALEVFKTMKAKDVVAWGSMLSAYGQNKKFGEALHLFRTMQLDDVKLDSNAIVSIVNACAGIGNADLGCCIHGYVIKNGLESDSFVGSSLIDVYSKCGQPEMAQNVYSNISHKTLVVCNSLVSCYCRNDLPEKCINLFPEILQYGLCPDPISITTVLAAVSSLAALLKGKAIHAYQIRLGIPEDIQVGNALIDMYIKCGSLKYAQNVFQSMSKGNLVTWNSMIAGYGSHGECLKSIDLFKEMTNSRIMPDDITFLSLISSCNHSGLVYEGLKLFGSMRKYGIEPKVEHYIHVVDLLGRAGCLNDAYGVVHNMPFKPDRSIWLCLLSACRVHPNVELAELAAKNLLEMEPTRGSNYVQLLNLYVEAGLWEKAANLRASMKQGGLKKIPGCSWIEVKDKVDVFFSGDSSSTQTVQIYETLSSLRSNMRRREASYDALDVL